MPVSTLEPLTSHHENSNLAVPAGASQEIRDAALTLRKLRLARFVRGVVVTCAVVCVAGLVSKVARAFSSEEAEAVAAPVHVSLGRDLPATVDQIVASVDSLSARTLHAIHVDEHRAAARMKKASRSRYTW